MGFNWASDSVGRLSGKTFPSSEVSKPLREAQADGASDEEEHLRVHNKNNVMLPESEQHYEIGIFCFLNLQP